MCVCLYFRVVQRVQKLKTSQRKQSHRWSQSVEIWEQPSEKGRLWHFCVSNLKDTVINICLSSVFVGGRVLGGPSEPQCTAGTFPQTHIPGQRRSEGFCSILWPKAQKQPGFTWQGEAYLSCHATTSWRRQLEHAETQLCGQQDKLTTGVFGISATAVDSCFSRYCRRDRSH